MPREICHNDPFIFTKTDNSTDKMWTIPNGEPCWCRSRSIMNTSLHVILHPLNFVLRVSISVGLCEPTITVYYSLQFCILIRSNRSVSMLPFQPQAKMSSNSNVSVFLT